MAEILERLRRDALQILRAGLDAASPERAVEGLVGPEGRTLVSGNRLFELDSFRRVFLIGAGKASRRMAHPIANMLGDRLTEGVLSVPRGQGGVLGRVRFLEASHPLPDESGASNTREILELADSAGDDDLVICLISGGGSSLLVAPPEGITIDELALVNVLLLACGAGISEVNMVRKHVSAVKGGRLARRICPASSVTLAVSDVPGDDMSSIASGPTVPDSTSFEDAIRVLERHGLTDRAPRTVLTHLRRGAAGLIEENPRKTDPVFSKSCSAVVLTNSTSLDGCCAEAGRMGYGVYRLPDPVCGETVEAALRHVTLAREILAGDGPVSPPACIVSGGETTSKVTGTGRGGRNQDFVLAAVERMDGLPTVLLSADTDGIDGTSDAAGAIGDGETKARAEKLGLSAALHLVQSDSHTFFSTLGDLVMTGQTGTNVMDIHVMLVG